MAKFKPVLQERVIKEQKKEEEQRNLRKKYGISDKKTVLVKKESLFTAFTKLFGRIFQKILTVFLLSLAFNGIVAFIHPDSRAVLFYIYQDAVRQMKILCPFLR